jgi:hypothetical protein
MGSDRIAAGKRIAEFLADRFGVKRIKRSSLDQRRLLRLTNSSDPQAKKGSRIANTDVAGSAWPLELIPSSQALDHMSFSPGMGSRRREFFRDAARYALLCALTALASRTVGKGRQGVLCINRGACSECGLFVSCNLPAAVSARVTKPGPLHEAPEQKS